MPQRLPLRISSKAINARSNAAIDERGAARFCEPLLNAGGWNRYADLDARFFSSAGDSASRGHVMSRLTGKGVLITGGGSGIGLAAARLFLQEGATVAITGRDAAKLGRAAESLKAGERLKTHAADVSNPDQVQKLVAAMTQALGRIDILVNNAGLNIRERSSPNSRRKAGRTS